MWNPDEASRQELKRLAVLLRDEKPKSKFDKAIEDALKLFNKALSEAPKPKIRKKYPIYPPKVIAGKKAWR